MNLFIIKLCSHQNVITFLPFRGIRKMLQHWFAQSKIGILKGLFHLHEFIGTLSYVVTYYKKTLKQFAIFNVLFLTLHVVSMEFNS